MPGLSPKFYHKLLEVSSSTGIPPEDLLNVMTLESGLNPSAGTNAVGLVQILPKYLKNFGYSGSGDDFKKESAEEQLIYIERLIKSNMNAFNGGKPFKSVTQYYVSNFIPVALKLSGVQQEDPTTIICSKDSEVPHLPGVSLKTEKLYYNSNSGLDVDKDGSITYGDLTKMLSKVTGRKVYQLALNEMKTHTGYDAKIPKIESHPEVKKNDELADLYKKYTEDEKKKPDQKSFIENLIEKFLKMIQASEQYNKKIYKKYLPTQHVLIQVNSSDPIDSIEFSRILCAASEEELLANSYTYTDGKNIEVECDIYGPQKECFAAIKQLTNSLSAVFKQATNKIGGIDIKTNLIINKKSSYKEISGKFAELNYRKFMFKFI